MVGWKQPGSEIDPNSSPMNMPKARNYIMSSGKYEGCPLGFVVNTDPGFILWLRTSGYGSAKQAAIRLGPMAEKVVAELTETAENSLGDFKMDDMPF